MDGNSVVVTYTYPIKGGNGSSGNGGVLCSERLSTPGRTRTCYPLLRRQMLYPDELRGQFFLFVLATPGTVGTVAPLSIHSLGFAAKLCSLAVFSPAVLRTYTKLCCLREYCK